MNTLSLPQSCDRAAAKAIYTALCEGLGPAPLAVHADGVEKIGQAMAASSSLNPAPPFAKRSNWRALNLFSWSQAHDERR